MGYTTLGLMLGYGCNARCRSCLWGDLLNRKDRMSAEDACAWVDQAYGLGELRLVGFSGGEPFVFLETMKEVMRYAKETYDLPSVAVTNAFWAKTPRAAREQLGALYDLGLRQLLLSVDDFHQEWIPLERVRNALEASRELGIAPTLQCVVTASSKKLSHYLEALGVKEGDEVMASEVPCAPIGFAAGLSASEFPQHSEIPCDYCSLLQTLIVRPEGSVHLCCGPAFTIPVLDVGNIREEPLEEIIERAEWNPLYNALALDNGPGGRVKDVLAEAGELPTTGFASSCHACHHLLTRSGVAEQLEEALALQQAELFLKRTIVDQETTRRGSDILNL
ncbi:MAG: radical SAM protein [bacterium]|nr:radical SAM protein [bacterium]